MSLTAKASISTTEEGSLRVDVTWEGEPLDRSIGLCYGLKSSHGKLASRLIAAINAQRVFTHAAILKDRDGKTYVSAATNVWGRTLNRDLKRLGF